jgi:hypothetical protein
MPSAALNALFQLYGGSVRNIFTDRKSDVEQRRVEIVDMVGNLNIVKSTRTVGAATTTAGKYAGLLFSIVPSQFLTPRRIGNNRTH